MDWFQLDLLDSEYPIKIISKFSYPLQFYYYFFHGKSMYYNTYWKKLYIHEWKLYMLLLQLLVMTTPIALYVRQCQQFKSDIFSFLSFYFSFHRWMAPNTTIHESTLLLQWLTSDHILLREKKTTIFYPFRCSRMLTEVDLMIKLLHHNIRIYCVKTAIFWRASCFDSYIHKSSRWFSNIKHER